MNKVIYLVSYYVYQAYIYLFRYQDLHVLVLLYVCSTTPVIFKLKNAIQIYFRGYFT